MRIFKWDGEVQRKMSPVDSLKHSLMLLQAGLLAMDPKSGEIKAWVGGIDFRHFKYDHVTAKRQSGSTFKPILYAAALESGISPCYPFENERKVYAEYADWSPENAGGEYGGYYTLQGALTKSVNTISAELIMQTGVPPVTQLAHNMGIESEIPEEPSIALGSADISLKEMTTAYCVFANGGNRVEPQYLMTVTDRQGNVLIDNVKKTSSITRVLPATTAHVITHFLQSVVDSGTAASLRSQYGLTQDIAGKTGTTQDQADGWFIGYTPDLVCGVWVGADNPQIHFKGLNYGQGAKTALPIWALFMKQVTTDPDFTLIKQGQFPHLDESLAETLDCPMYKEDLNFLEKFFAQKHRDFRRGRDDEYYGYGDADAYTYTYEPKPQKPTPREKIRRFFGRKNR
jgi:penicillin-binding protein 1A